MTLPSYAVLFRGHPACPCQAKWLPVLEAEAQRRGLIEGELPISQLIGGDPRSGGTHVDGGEADFFPLGAISKVDGKGGFVWLCRQMGADATWHRPFNWDGQNGVEHVHSGLTGCPHNVHAAGYQLTAVRNGFNGLGAGGEAARDDGPRPLSGRTWRQGITWAKEQEDMPFTDWPQKDQDALVNAVADRVTERILSADMNAHDPKGDVAFRGMPVRDLLKKVARKVGAV